MKLKQFIEKYPNKMFIRFFFDIEYNYGTTTHCCVYLKYEKDNFQKSADVFRMLFNVWSIGQLDNKRTIKGYDKVFKANELTQQLKNIQTINVENIDGQYYFLEII